MSVIVMGTGMPEIISDCPLNSFGVCHARGKGPLNCWEASDAKGTLPDWCPLRHLPDVHGRLIDADAFEAFVQEKWEQNEISNGDWMSFREWLRDQKTIIEAEA